jgi:prepilin-type N-terminal cleavage/methylation domain-containing protein/prepilin-type processing-associated H-X9-DG protein
MKRGFTLIELLVVIAIIAILAAILFPVFAQAREQARKTTCLSNLKQIDLSVQMYVQDYDEVFPTSSSNGMVGEPTYLCQPYIKNYAILFCPDRNVGTGTLMPIEPNLACGGIDNPNCESKLYGYGWNAGSGFPGGYSGYWTDGLFASFNFNVPYSYTSPGGVVYAGTTYQCVGAALAAVASPAMMFMMGDTADAPRQSMSHKRLSACVAPSEYDTMPRHSGGNSFCFADGHVKFLKYVNGPYHNDLNPTNKTTSVTIPPVGGVSVTCIEEQTVPDPCMYNINYDGSNGETSATNHCAGL